MIRILLNITHGFQARMLLRTRIADDLTAAAVELVVVSPNASESYFRREFGRQGFVLESMPVRFSTAEKFIVNTRSYFLMNPSLGATLGYKRERYRRNAPIRWAISRAANVVLGRVPALRRGYLATERRVFDGTEFDPLLRQHRPDLIVAGTPGFDTQDAHLLRAARRNGIPTATVMLSWDNLTSKGYMGAQPDCLLVWSDLMAEEARRYHDFKGRIIEVGAAQFDIYASLQQSLDRSVWKQQHQVPPDAPLIVWGTINEQIYPDQITLLRDFIARLDDIDRKAVLWVRIHPQSVFGPFEHLTARYRALESPRVKIELPRVASRSLQWDLPKDDMRHLASLLVAADLVVTPRSTLTIDAACAQTPVINLAIDREFAKGFQYTHYRNIVKHDGAWIVASFAELIGAATRYLAEPSLHREGRAAIVREQMGRWFGRAGERTARVLHSLATDPAEVLPGRTLPLACNVAELDFRGSSTGAPE